MRARVSAAPIRMVSCAWPAMHAAVSLLATGVSSMGEKNRSDMGIMGYSSTAFWNEAVRLHGSGI